MADTKSSAELAHEILAARGGLLNEIIPALQLAKGQQHTHESDHTHENNESTKPVEPSLRGG